MNITMIELPEDSITEFGEVQPPRFESPTREDVDISCAHLGAKLQRLPMTPQGERLARVLEARTNGVRHTFRSVVVQVPRRATKTTSIQNVLLGRCLTIPNYSVVSTAQDGTRASEYMRDLMGLIQDHATAIMELRHEEMLDADPDADTEKYQLKHAYDELGIRTMYWSQQREFIKFKNGSKWRTAKPDPASIRGGKADCIWFDEAGELDPETSPALMGGTLPLMDTRPRAQVIFSGTPGPQRAGGFFTELEAARSAPDRKGIFDYSASEADDISDPAVWLRVHPGAACGLTPLDVLQERWDDPKLGAQKFAMEYLCLWPEDAQGTALDLARYRESIVEPVPFAGQDFDLAFDCHIHGLYGAIWAVWMEGDIAHAQCMAYGPGTDWMVVELIKAQKAHPRVDISYDPIGSNTAVATELGGNARFNPKALRPKMVRDIAGGCQMLVTRMDRGTLKIGSSPSLDRAVEAAGWRFQGDNRLFKRKDASADIASLNAVAIGLAAATSRPTRTAGGWSDGIAT